MKPQVPPDRATAPDSLTAIAHRLDSIDGKLTRLLNATQDAVNEALLIKEDNVKINSAVAASRRRVEDLEAWKDDVEARLLALESGRAVP